ncbi:MAG: iron-containing alcohol dehydrogenase [Nitrososphaerota archaeon]|nr:iron-containing alcohol dehydrogenase [Nitrososphaerota archaeon]
MRVLEFSGEIGSHEGCGCGFKHDKSLKEVVFAPLREALDHLGQLDLHPPYAVFYDDVTYRIAGRTVQKVLGARGVRVASPTFREAEEKAQMLGAVKTVIAVGGGTVIDVAKYAAYVSGADFVSIPTAPSHDGIVSPIASLFAEGRRVSILTRAPATALIDVSLLSSAPHELITSGFGDILAKTVSIKDWQLGRDEASEAYCKSAESFTLRAINAVIDALKGGHDFTERVELLATALINSGVAMMIVRSSRPASGSEHLISHYLDMKLDRRLRHGIQCGIAALVMAILHEKWNPNWWEDEAYRSDGLREYLSKAGVPLRLDEAGISGELMAEAISEAWRIRPDRYTILHKHRPSREEAFELLRESGLI